MIINVTNSLEDALCPVLKGIISRMEISQHISLIISKHHNHIMNDLFIGKAKKIRYSGHLQPRIIAP